MFRHFVGGVQQATKVIPLAGDQRVASTVGHGHGECNIARRDGQLLQIDGDFQLRIFLNRRRQFFQIGTTVLHGRNAK